MTPSDVDELLEKAERNNLGDPLSVTLGSCYKFPGSFALEGVPG